MFIIYETTNLITGQKYIGQHKTENLEDGYLGSGKLLRRAIEKHGVGRFQRRILKICHTRNEANIVEKELVTQDIVDSPEYYNLKLGGEGGFDHITKPGGAGNASWQQGRWKKRREEYEANPKFCATCSKLIPFEKNHLTYCGHSCSAKTNNRKRITGCEPGLKTPLQGDSEGFNSLTVHQMRQVSSSTVERPC